MNWLVYLSGDELPVGAISRSIPDVLFSTGPEGGRYALFFDSSKGFSSIEEVRSRAMEEISALGGISRLVLNTNPCMAVEEISQTDLRATDLFSGRQSSGTCGTIISCDDDDETEIQVKNPFESVYLAVSADECLKSAIIEIREDFNSWAGLLRVYARIESCIGSPASKGWCSPDEQAWFLDSARLSLSEDEKDDLFSPMYISEAESFVTILMQEWIKEKKRELDI